MNINKSDIAVALCGGGGKGAFQVGVWKALDEMNLFEKIKAVSGTSVGGLNSLLFAIGNYELAKEIWYAIDNDTLLAKSGGNENGLFSRQRLKDIIRGVLSENRPKNFKMQAYVTIQNASTKSFEYVCLNNLKRRDITSHLLATSAIPVAYDSVEIDNEKFIDGGFASPFGNSPVKPLYDLGYRNIYIVAMKKDFDIFKIKMPDSNETIGEHYSDCNFTVIRPSKNLGGTLNFDPQLICSRMDMGYQCANEVLRQDTPDKDKTTDKPARFDSVNMGILEKTFKLLKSGDDYEEFIASAHRGQPNWELKVIGGYIWYITIASADGWQIQWHQAPLMKMHYRIIDNNNVRRAWYLNSRDLLMDLENFETDKASLTS